MQLSDFDYHLPEELVAKQPLAKRSDSRMMLVDLPTGRIEHAKFADFPSLLSAHDLMVMNNTKVIPARLDAIKASGGRVSIQVERVIDAHTFSAQLKASKAPKVGGTLHLGPHVLTVLAHENPFYLLKSDDLIATILSDHGRMPLPPYMQREADALDASRYQTVYADRQGAVAAPTAGLHFDEPTLKACHARGVSQSFVTLHVGAGTFLPVRVNHIHDHPMHAESIWVDQSCCDAVASCQKQGGHVVAVGTTSLRALESAARMHDGNLQPFSGETRLFITPGDDFLVVDHLLTNFHLPKSTLLMLVGAFAGMDLMKKAYQAAIEARYRFYSYGDAMFINRSERSWF